MKKIVLATSDYDGYFEELVMINEDQVISLGEEEESGVHSIKVMEDGKEEEWYYIDIMYIE